VALARLLGQIDLPDSLAPALVESYLTAQQDRAEDCSRG
jgi:hypothetical protein